ncbi:hypothetical protein GALMADRAFT_208048 [Galerina marginata CBS 339.88]|uniref:Uncharacterized protein n=1 Tax=Galerina marginata (strain CBS 339.88) TaxID=685588 RepID=A0A067TDK3_GALM3|nr:hypothetical protein GALMADRAFT_208048 [Galerina marginata CBS 339.88]
MSLVEFQTPTTHENLIATIVSAVNYGIVLFLSFACVRTLSKSTKYTVKKRRFFYFYIIAMLFFSTFALGLDIYSSPRRQFADFEPPALSDFSPGPPPPTGVEGFAGSIANEFSLGGVSFFQLCFLPIVIGLADSVMGNISALLFISLRVKFIVISPLSIIYRVVAGIDVTTTLNITDVIGDGVIEDIHFVSGHGVSTHRSENGV